MLNSTIEKCKNDANDISKGMKVGHRLEVLEDGTIMLTNWEHYQGMPGKRDRPYLSAADLYAEQLKGEGKSVKDILGKQ